MRLYFASLLAALSIPLLVQISSAQRFFSTPAEHLRVPATPEGHGTPPGPSVNPSTGQLQPEEQYPRSLVIHNSNLNPLYRARGYRMGFLSRSTLSGYVIKTVEGELALGYNSSESSITDPECVEKRLADLSPRELREDANLARQNVESRCKILINPWRFSSSDSRLQLELQTLRGGPVLFYYDSARIVLWTATKNLIRQVYQVQKNRKIPYWSLNRIDKFWFSRHGGAHYGQGSLEGRIVRMVLTGNIRQSYEATIQVGPAGNNFVNMSVASSDMYEYIVQVMATGRYLRVRYLQLYDLAHFAPWLIFGYETNYRIYAVEVIERD